MRMCLSLTERDRRFAEVRAAMTARGFDALLFPPNTGDWDNLQPGLRYLTSVGGGGVATAGVFTMSGEPVVAIRESRRVPWWQAAQDWVRDIRFPKDMSWSGFFIDVLSERGLTKGRVGIVGLDDVLREPEGTIAFVTMQRLQAALPNLSFHSAEGILHAIRKRKSAEEIALMEKAQACCDAVRASLRQNVWPGRTQGAIYGALHQAYLESGGEMPSMFLFAAEPRMWQTHLLPQSERELTADDVVIIEADTKYLGYTAQAVDTVSLRKFTALEQRLFATSAECFHAVLAAMKPGCPYADLIRIWGEIASRAGQRAGRTMGHGLGLGQDGPITRPGGKAADLDIEEGDCFVLKPWIADEADQISVRVGGLVVVEQGKARRAGSLGLDPLVMT